MPSSDSSNVWLWKDPDKRWLNNVIDYIKEHTGSSNEIVILCCEDLEDFTKNMPFMYYFFHLSALLQMFENERIMFLNLKDVVSSIELCLTRQKKNDETSELKDDEILSFYKSYVAHFQSDCLESGELIKSFKDLLKQNNCIDSYHLQEMYRKIPKKDIKNCVDDQVFLILGIPRFPIFKNFIGFLIDENLTSLTIETPLDISLHSSPNGQNSSKIRLTHESLTLEEVPLNTEYGLSAGSATEEYVEDIILSFLSLIINSRNELALSKAMISPIINLSHEAFTALKHMSLEKDMPMCQVAISYVTRVRLGGKGYAPPKDCPMLPHLKGLEMFVDILHQMQVIIEEEPEPKSVLKRLINILQKKLLRCKSDKLKESSIETVAKTLQSKIAIISEITTPINSSKESQLCQKSLDFIYHFVNFINCSHFLDDPIVVLSRKNAKRTPLNLPPLLGYFRTPDDESSSDTKSSLQEDSNLSRNSLIRPPAFLSYFHHSESSDMSSCLNSSTPSKLTFKGVIKESSTNENEIKLPVSSSVICQNSNSMKNRKRCILGEVTNGNDALKIKNVSSDKKNSKKFCKVIDSSSKENATKSTKKTQPKKEVKKFGKKFKQIEGQGKITSFFIMNKNN